ncbi:hypothetical protein [Rhodomicrobium lacus]|uniref:hypothetical protein n=1 Tax=Rhodomicrobium lacus TaxID=2498452 RepID=UPI000F8D1D0A|nr:hypothetical protein [Rhodomicrobium lacus]
MQEGPTERDDPPHKAFAKRFEDVCENHPAVPDFSRGRYRWIRDELEARFGIIVGRETVRKWHTGETIPRNDKMKALAELLSVDYGWLAFGIRPELDVEKRPARVLAESAAANLIAGFIQLAGGHCAFPEADAPNSFVDVYAILGNRQRALAISLAKPQENGKLRFSVTNEYAKCTVIGVVQTGIGSIDMYVIPPQLIERHGVLRGPSTDIEAEDKKAKGILVGGLILSKIVDFKSDFARSLSS